MSAALLDESRRRLDAGDPASALRLARRALDSSPSAGSDPARAAAAHLVGESLYVTGDFAAARESVPVGTQPDELPLSARREQILADPDPLADELLPDVDEASWATLEHAYGPVLDTPLHLRLLAAEIARNGSGPPHTDLADVLGDLPDRT